MTPKVFASCALLASLLAVRAASAQAQFVAQPDSPSWLKDRRYGEGIGVRVGDFELHPGVAVEGGYDSNWLLRSDRQGVDNGPPSAPVIPALEFRETLSASLSTVASAQRREGQAGTAPNLAFHAGLNLTWRQFDGLSSASAGPNDITQENSGLPSVGADARLDILAGQPVGGALFASYGRVVQPNMTTLDPNLSFNRDDIGAGGELAIQPASGTLDWHFGYQFHTELFENEDPSGLNNLTHQLYTRGRWRFRPRTALITDASIGFTSYTQPTYAQQQGLVGSTPVRARVGLNGLITDRFSALAIVGWASSFDDTTNVPQQKQYDSVIGQAELRWYLAASPGIAALTQDVGLSLSTIALGYTRDFQNSYLGNFYGIDRGYLQLAYFFAGRMLLTLEGGVGAIEYPDMYWLPSALPAPAPPPTPTLRHNAFTDIRADGTLFAEYRFSNTLGLNTTVRYTTNISSVHDMPDIYGSPTSVFDMAWNRFEAFLGLRWFM